MPYHVHALALNKFSFCYRHCILFSSTHIYHVRSLTHAQLLSTPTLPIFTTLLSTYVTCLCTNVADHFLLPSLTVNPTYDTCLLKHTHTHTTSRHRIPPSTAHVFLPLLNPLTPTSHSHFYYSYRRVDSSSEMNISTTNNAGRPYYNRLYHFPIP